jgi:hypothetical protein
MKALIFFILCTASLAAAPLPADKVLVLGTVRGTFSDIEDRIFREEIMRQISSRGVPIVAIMDLEHEIVDNNVKIRDLNSGQKKSLAKKMGARWIIFGSFIVDKKQVFSFTILDVVNGTEIRKEIPLDKKTPIQSHWQSIAEIVADMACVHITSLSAK